MTHITIVGSGPSAVHFALSVLKKGHQVVMVDVGESRPDPVSPEQSFNQLKMGLRDPAEYFLGRSFEAVTYPGTPGEYYGFPPNKRYVFLPPPNYHVEADGFSPLASFAQGGLAEAWTGGVYPFNEHEFRDFPIEYSQMQSCYSEVAKRIGISGLQDDLSAFMPMHDHILSPLNLDEHSEDLLQKYERKKSFFRGRLNCVMGRGRLAAISQPGLQRHACSYRGRCLWGCPQDSLYTPSLTLEECKRYESFRYAPGRYASHFRIDQHGRASHLLVDRLDCAGREEWALDKLVLGAGTLSTSRIVLESVRQRDGTILTLTGLMDNQQVLVPFVNLDFLGRAYSDERYQYHQIAFGLINDDPCDYVHCLLTTLKSALVHPLIHRTPADMRFAIFLFRHLRAALGLVNVNLSDDRRSTNYVTLQNGDMKTDATLTIHYEPGGAHVNKVRQALRRVKSVLWQLNCVVPPGQVHVRPMGAGVHYAGTLPMCRERRPMAVSPNGQSYDFRNVYIVDGSTFPALPAKNITFTLMSNAVRIAQTNF